MGTPVSQAFQKPCATQQHKEMQQAAIAVHASMASLVLGCIELGQGCSLTFQKCQQHKHTRSKSENLEQCKHQMLLLTQNPCEGPPPTFRSPEVTSAGSMPGHFCPWQGAKYVGMFWEWEAVHPHSTDLFATPSQMPCRPDGLNKNSFSLPNQSSAPFGSSLPFGALGVQGW